MRTTLLAMLLLVGTAAAAQDKSPEAAASSVTWATVAPIVWKHCTPCHRAGEVAPFSLQSYEEVRKHGRDIVTVTGNRTMPVWKPEKGFADFAGDRRMPDEDIGTLKKWVEAGMPEGEAKAPEMPKFASGWLHGEPDMIVTMPEEYTVPAEGRDIYRNFAIPLNLTEDKYVRAFQYRPGNAKVVHHALMFLDTTGESRRKDENDPKPGFGGGGLGLGAFSGGGLGGWAPGGVGLPMPDGYGKLIKRNSDLLLQLHLHPSGKAEKEKSQIGLWFCKEKPKKQVAMLPLANRNINIAPGEKDHKIEQSFVAPVDFEIIGIVPHAHYLAKEMKVWGTAQGKEVPLIWIKDWDFDWQEQYQYAKPVKITRGTKIEMIYTYDNSADNPKNPVNPPVRVRWGEQTTNEMAITFFSVVTENQGDYLQLMGAIALKFGRGK
jgi:hypothetical protein